MTTPTKHPRRRIHEYGMPMSDYLPSEITYNGANSGEHQRDRATFDALIGENTWEAFGKAYGLIANNGYRVAITDVPDSPSGARARFVQWVREHVGRNTATGLAGQGWFEW